MTQVLHINSSIFGADGQSSKLASDFVSRWQSRDADIHVTFRDLADEPVPHLTAEVFSAAITPKGERSDTQNATAALADTLVGEILEADAIVIGLPMYNFGLPTALKAWVDHIARAGTTFRYTENGPVGLLGGKKVYVFATRGGYYQGTGADLQTQYIRQLFGLLGINDIEFVYAEGLAISEEIKTRALNNASEQITKLAA